jgi:hypothetical protein
MKNIRTIQEVFHSTKEEIKEFFDAASFRGEFKLLSAEERMTATWACGKVENISINEQSNDLCPQSLWIPMKFKSDVKIGMCRFKAIVDFESLKANPPRYKLLVLSIENDVTVYRQDLKQKQYPHRNLKQKGNLIITPRNDSGQEIMFKRNLKLKDNRFVGQFIINKDGGVTIRDIRRRDFSKLILQNGKEQQPIVYHPHKFKPQDGKYYEFTWVLDGVRDDYIYLFKVDEERPIIEITPQNLIQRLHDDIMNYPPGAGQKIVKVLDTLKNQLTASGKEIFIYELLQNANDYPNIVGNVKQKVDVAFHLTQSSLIFMHTGAEFNEKNIAAICSINDKEKDANKDSIGYKGIGFKTVFLDNEDVYLQTGGYSFRFDRQATKDVVDTPWQILPIWTKYSELTLAEQAIFSHASEEFRVKFSLKPTSQKTLRAINRNYEQMFREVFANERVILFIPNLANVRIYLHGTPMPDITCSRNNDKWRVDNFEVSIDESITEAINADIEKQENLGGLKIPTKYYDFRKTKVSFACEVSDGQLKPVRDTCLYCYLPAKEAKWGLKFLMNTDMIPNGARDNIEVEFDNTTNINAEIAKISGAKFFEWIFTLCDSKKYEYDSIFALIPNFATIKREHGRFKSLIDLFKGGFDERIAKEEIVPIENGYTFVSKTVYDKTGLSASGIISDELFLLYTNNGSKCLPVDELRKSKSFDAFLGTYLEELDVIENEFNIDSLHELVRSKEFQEWLKVQENNDKFLQFLLDNDYLTDFLYEDIFIENECDNLYAAKDLYYDVDEELKDLSAFSNYIPYLSLSTRRFFANNIKWDEVRDDAFKKFNADNFISRTLLSENNYDDTVRILTDWNASYHFYSFLAKKEITPKCIKDLPFFNDEDTSVSDFNDKFVFFASADGKQTCAESWLRTVTFVFVSPDYDKATLKYLAKHAGVREFSHTIIADDIVLSDTYGGDINDKQQNDVDTSKQFVNYCFTNKDLYSGGKLHKYALKCVDLNGNSEYVLPEDHIYFPSLVYDNYAEKKWLNADWMYCLDKDYLFLQPDTENLKIFIHDAFLVDDIDAEKFYKSIVKKNIPNIIKNTSDSENDGSKNIDFVAYLDDNYKLIFEDEKDDDKYRSFVFLGNNADDAFYDISTKSAHLYAYDDELKGMMEEPWFPDAIVDMCTKCYGTSKAILKMGAKVYSFGSFFTEVITKELTVINHAVDTREKSIAFHSYIVSHKSELTDIQKSEMKRAKIYLYGCESASISATGHKILSSKARELFDKELVEFSELDIIDPDYNIETNSDYWENTLGNAKFTINHFMAWLKNHTIVFCTTIKDKTRNIAFWRWAKDNLSDTTIDELPVLPILVGDNAYADMEETIYISDSYIERGSIESIVRKYDNNALFVSGEYIEEGDDVNAWKVFWNKIGLFSEVIDILTQTIIPKLDEIDDEKLPATIANYRNQIEEKYDDLPKALAKLRVKARDGNFYSMKDTLYVNTEKEEPFIYIELPNQIRFETGEERRLIKDIIESINGNLIDNKTDWQKAKIIRYIAIQDNKEDELHTIHYRFIDELTAMYDNDRFSLDVFDDLQKVLLLDNNEHFVSPEILTLSSVYNPYCDFQQNMIDQLRYTSDTYKEECTLYVGKIFSKIFKVHHDFVKADARFLTNRQFSIYFWSKYLPLKRERGSLQRIKEYMEDNTFNEFACIPTKDYMKKPSELYSVRISNYVKKIENWENKLPLNEIPNIRLEGDKDLFDFLPFMLGLAFNDCLYALFSFQGKESRQEIIRWAIQDYQNRFENNVTKYREDEGAMWTNAQNERVHIKTLYALDKNSTILEQYFRGSGRIINQEYFPSNFREACDIFQIKTIEEVDLIVDPENAHKEDEQCTKKLFELYTLIIAGIEDNTKWQVLYEKYKTKVEAMELWACDSISFQYKYDADISQKLRKFSHMPNSNDFYYVGSLNDKRVFKSFVDSFKEYLGITAEIDLVEEIMSDLQSAFDTIKQYNDLLTNEEFMGCLSTLEPSWGKKLRGKTADYTDESEEDTRHTYSTLDDKDKEDETMSILGSTTSNATMPPMVHVREHDRNYPGSGNSNADKYIEAPDEYVHIDDTHEINDEIEDNTNENTNSTSIHSPQHLYDPDKKSYMGSVEKDKDYQPLGERILDNRIRRHPKPYTKDEINRLRSNGTPLELESLPPTTEELDMLNQCNIRPEQIADTNYLAQLRLYLNLTKEQHEFPEESMEEFVHNANDVTTHKLRDGRYIHTCSAARGVMYISPSVWEKMVDDKWRICVYLDGQGKNFHYINNAEEFLSLVDKDDVVIKITGKEKKQVVNSLYSGLLNNVKGTAYTLVRVAARTNMDAVFAHYIGAMAEIEDGNEDINDY